MKKVEMNVYTFCTETEDSLTKYIRWYEHQGESEMTKFKNTEYFRLFYEFFTLKSKFF